MATQHQPYQRISQDANIEFRYYPAATFARVHVQGPNLLNTGFRHLANYIFGGNQANQSIAMTIPVVLEREREKEKTVVSNESVLPKVS